MSGPSVHTLSNGVRVVCDPIGGLESLALSVVIDGGARWETPETAGWAHMLEHMVFKGAGARSAREIVEAIEGEGGHINAATGQERTSFQVRCLKDGLPLGMAVLADLVRRPTLDPADLDKEKGVIAQEIAEAADTPDDKVFELAQARAYRGALGRPILGAVETLAPATAETLSAFHQGLYAADRIVVSAAGAVDEDTLLRLTEQAFGDACPPGTPLERPAPTAFDGGHAREARKLEQAHLVLLLPALSRHDPDYFALTLFTETLGGGMASRLFQTVREAHGLAYAIDAYADVYEDIGALGVYAGTSAKDAAPAARLTAEAIKALAADGVSEGELKRAKAQTKGGLFMRRESPLARAEANASNLLSFGRLFGADELAARIDAVTAEDLRRVGERVLAPRRAATAVLGPKAATGAGEAFGEALTAG